MKKIFTFSFVLLIILSLTACTSKFDGSRTGNDSQFIMDFKVLDKTDSQLLELEQGDIIDVDIASDSGQLNIEVQKDNDEPIYKSENVPTSSFQIEIPESGTYKFSVTGEKAKGSVCFIKQTSK